VARRQRRQSARALSSTGRRWEATRAVSSGITSGGFASMPSRGSLRGDGKPVRAIAAAADGSVWASADEGTVHLWDPKTHHPRGTLRKRRRQGPRTGHARWVPP
jgi:hypothetical protein